MSSSSKTKPSLEEVFSPRSVAIVGASAEGRGEVARLKDSGFPVIYPVNPKYTEVLGLPCYPSVRDIPGVVDYVRVSIPAEAVMPVLDDCAAKGVKVVQFFTSGFSETGDSNRAQREKELLDKARAGGFRIIGPNCQGSVIPKLGLMFWGDPLVDGPISFLVQSGGHAHDLLYLGAPRGLGYSKGVSYGNALDINETELIEYFNRDPETEIIAAYLEGIRDGRGFVTALREAAARKPVVIYKSGVTEAGQRAAQGHTSSLASSIPVFNALCHQLGAVVVDNLDEMVDMLSAFRYARPLPRGTGVAVAGQGGGANVYASDEVEKAGLKMPRFSAEVYSELTQFSRIPGSILTNPIDTPNIQTPDGILATFRILEKIPEVHIVAYHLGFHAVSRWSSPRLAPAAFEPVFNAFKQVRQEMSKPIVIVMRPATNHAEMDNFLGIQKSFAEAGFPIFLSLSQMAKAMSRLVAWSKWHSGII